MLRLLAFLCTVHLAISLSPKKPCFNLPVDPAVIGKELSANGGCSQGGFRFGSTLRIEKWGVFLRPFYNLALDYESEVCPEEIVSVFRKSDKMAMLYHRPSTPASFFAKRTPDLYKRYLINRDVRFPCASVPVNQVFVWKQRTLFIKLVRKMVKDCETIRGSNVNCEGVYTPVKTTRTQKEVNVIVERQLVANAAINYLRHIAFNNFFCVS